MTCSESLGSGTPSHCQNSPEWDQTRWRNLFQTTSPPIPSNLSSSVFQYFTFFHLSQFASSHCLKLYDTPVYCVIYLYSTYTVNNPIKFRCDSGGAEPNLMGVGKFLNPTPPLSRQKLTDSDMFFLTVRLANTWFRLEMSVLF